MKRSPERQAVVLIHGIGEQKPMATLRAFVKAMLRRSRHGEDRFWSKPDPSSNLFELRRLQTKDPLNTHFYEFYWAHHIRGTTWRQLLTWLRTLLVRLPQDVPPSVRQLWIITLIISASVITTLTLGVIDAVRSGVSWQSYWLYLSGGLSVAAVILQKMFVSYLGDAARYLSPTPENVAVRQAIRAEGLRLLRYLHDSKEYKRVILVGHSLGSVIGYDLVTWYWIEQNRLFNFKDEAIRRDLLETLHRDPEEPKRQPQPMVQDGVRAAGEALKRNPTPVERDRFQDAQLLTWKEQRRWGNPWKITDFITIGSPLTHAQLLLASNAEEFEERKRQREFPTCPPVEDHGRYAYVPKEPVDLGDGKKFSPWILHHAAPFAVTRWTNLYFPTTLGVFGDFIGGPLQRDFGSGIEDVKVTWDSWLSHTPFAHTAYWKLATGCSRNGALTDWRTRSLFAVRRALRLDERIRR